MPRLSIVIPTKNEEAHLPRLLESIKRQTFSDYEVIVADAHSKDATREIAEHWGACVIGGGMPGPGRNQGARRAEGKIIAFLDADVQLPSAKFFEDCLKEMDRKKLDVATCRVKPLSRKPIDRALHEAYNAYAIAMEKILPHAPGCCIFVRQQTHQEIGGFDEEVVFAEDCDYVQRAFKHGSAFGILRSHPIAISVRRLEKDGRLGIALKFMYGELMMITKGSFKEMPFTYEMGGEVKDSQKDVQHE